MTTRQLSYWLAGGGAGVQPLCSTILLDAMSKPVDALVTPHGCDIPVPQWVSEAARNWGSSEEAVHMSRCGKQQKHTLNIRNRQLVWCALQMPCRPGLAHDAWVPLHCEVGHLCQMGRHAVGGVATVQHVHSKLVREQWQVRSSGSHLPNSGRVGASTAGRLVHMRVVLPEVPGKGHPPTLDPSPTPGLEVNVVCKLVKAAVGRVAPQVALYV